MLRQWAEAKALRQLRIKIWYLQMIKFDILSICFDLYIYEIIMIYMTEIIMIYTYMTKIIMIVSIHLIFFMYKCLYNTMKTYWKREKDT